MNLNGMLGDVVFSKLSIIAKKYISAYYNLPINHDIIC